jgi:hypothetical protein
MAHFYSTVRAGDPPKEAPMPKDPKPDLPPQECPQPSDPNDLPAPPEFPDQNNML